MVVIDGVARFYLVPDSVIQISQQPITERDAIQLSCQLTIINVSPWDDAPHPDPFGQDESAFAHSVETAPPACNVAESEPVAVKEEYESASLGSMWRLSRDPYISTNLACWVFSTIIFSALEPLLPLHFALPEVLNATPDEVGALFVALILPYVLCVTSSHLLYRQSPLGPLFFFYNCTERLTQLASFRTSSQDGTLWSLD